MIPMKGILPGAVVVMLLVAVGAWWLLRAPEPVVTEPPAATQPVEALSEENTAPATQLRVVASYLDLVREIDPVYATAQRLDHVVKFAESAKLVIERPLYVDAWRDLWITHPDAPPIEQTLKSAAQEQVHIVPVRVRYVRRVPAGRGALLPAVVAEHADGRFELIRPTGERETLPERPYLWSRAVDWQEMTLVPTRTGVSVLQFTSPATEQYFDFAERGLIELRDDEEATPPTLIPDLRGVLAFIPAEGSTPGGARTARYVDGTWTILDHSDSDRLLQLVPLLDGSLIRILADRDDTVRLDLVTLEAVEVDQRRILALVEQLSDIEQEKRDAAFEALQQYGQGIWPILEPIADQQPPEARIRIRQLLKNRIVPTLRGMSIVDNRLRVVERQPNGTVVFHAPQGVRITNERDQSTLVPAAWVAAGPWTGIQLLPERMTHELQPGRDIVRFVGGDWIVTNAALGPRQWVGNSFVPLLGTSHRSFMYVLASDRAGRWYFTGRDPAKVIEQPVLVVDRRLPDASPRLPVWVWHQPNARMGWDDQGYPGMMAGGAFVLDQTEWRNLDLTKETFHTSLPVQTASRSTTGPATTQPAHGEPLLVAEDGTRYFGGNEWLLVIDADGRETRWLLPPDAIGSARPWLVRTANDRLFLFNQAGRIVRIKPNPAGSAEPFAVEAVFTKAIPNVRDPVRIWLDPAGRLVILADEHRMAICFPDSRIPRPISLLMPAEEEEEEW